MPSIPMNGAGAASASPFGKALPSAGPQGQGASSRRLPFVQSSQLTNVTTNGKVKPQQAVDRLEQAGFMAEVLGSLRQSFNQRLSRDIANDSTTDTVERLLEAFDQEVSDIQDNTFDNTALVGLPSLEKLREALANQARMAIIRAKISSRRDQIATILEQQSALSSETPEELASILSEFEALNDSMGLAKTETALFLKNGKIQIALAAALSLIERAPGAAVKTVMSGSLKSLLPSALRQNLYAAAASREEEEKHKNAALVRMGETSLEDVDALITKPALEDLLALDAEPVRFSAAAREFLTQPLDWQSAELRRRLSKSSHSRSQRAEVDKLFRMHDRLRERLLTNPFEAAALLGLIDTTAPVDFSSPDSLRERVAITRRFETLLETKISPLDSLEVWQLVEHLSAADAKSLHATLNSLRIGLGEVMTIRVANQMLRTRPALAVVFARLELQPDTALTIASGLQRLLRLGKARLKIPRAEQGASPEATAFAEQSPGMMDALWAAAAALASHEIEIDPEGVSPERMESALQQVSGAITPENKGLFMFRDHPIMAPRGGLGAESLEALLRDLDESQFAAFSNGIPLQDNLKPAPFHELIESASVINRGFGHVGFVDAQGQQLLRGNRQDQDASDGYPFEFDVITAMRTRGSGRSLNGKTHARTAPLTAPDNNSTEE